MCENNEMKLFYKSRGLLWDPWLKLDIYKDDILQGYVFVDDLENSKWSNYVFDYNNIDKDKFFKIFNI